MQKVVRFLKYTVCFFVIGFTFVLFGCSSVPLTKPVAPPPVTTVQYGANTTITKHDVTHIVAPMETLWRISKMYGVSQQAIMSANRLKNPKELEIGQKLLIPDAARPKAIIPLYNTRPWGYIVIHHSATDEGNAFSIDKIHHQRGFWNGLGYHFLIDNGTLGKEMGQIEAGPRWIKQMDGAHCNASGMNENGIGICLVGNFSETGVPTQQLESLVFLVNVLRKHYSIPMDHVIGHGDVPGKATECPGKYFPWREFVRRLNDAAAGRQ